MGSQRTVIVVTGGDLVDASVLTQLPPAVAVVAADSGVDRAAELGLPVDVAVGDFDSVSTDALRALADSGAVIEQHPEAKDATDLEIGLDAARRFSPTHIVVVGGHGGRLDHFVANALLLTSQRYADLAITAKVGPATLTVVHSASAIHGQPGELVSLLPIAGPAQGVHTEGLVYPLAGEDLSPGSTRGVSNELVASTASVRLQTGVLLIVQPGFMGTHYLGATPSPVQTPDQRIIDA
ncbi:MAG: thiamine diphosphokinase [Acidimicrobiales bacterium]